MYYRSISSIYSNVSAEKEQKLFLLGSFVSENQNEQLQFYGVAAEDEPDGQAAEQGQGRGQPQRLRPALLGNRAVLPEPGVHCAGTAGTAALDGRRHRQ